MFLWRISDFDDLSGQGGLVAAGRWHSRGRPIVYLSDSPSTALLEILVRVDVQNFPDSVQVLKVNAGRIKIEKPKLPDFWRDDIDFTRGIGDAWLKSSSSALLKVSATVMPLAWNYLLNPSSPLAAKAAVANITHIKLDSRLK